MFKPHIGDCVECPRTNTIIPVKSGLCQYCNHERKTKNKQLCSSNIRNSTIRSTSKHTGEKEVFEEIAAEREWKCFVTGTELKELTATQFMHVLPKALNKYPLFKLYKRNIQIASNEVHYAWDFKPRSELKKDKRFDKLFTLEEELKQEYKLLKTKS